MTHSAQMITDCLDTRLQMPLNEALPDDVFSRSVAQILLTRMRDCGDMVISAPQLGMPVKMLGVRISGQSHVLFNPAVMRMSRPILVHGYLHPQTGQIRRDIWRYAEVHVEGMSFAGHKIMIGCEDMMAFRIQDAMEAMGFRPFSWLTPYHHAWARLERMGAGSGHASINTALYSAPANESELNELFRLTPNIMAWRLAGHDVAGKINGLDPATPCDLADVMLLLLALTMSGRRSVLIDSMTGLGLAVALSLAQPEIQLHLDGSPWPMQALQALGFGSSLVRHNFNLRAFTHGLPHLPTLDTIILHRGVADIDDHAIAWMAATLAKSTASLLVRSSGADPTLEDRLRRRFHAIYRFDTPDGGLIHVARQHEIDHTVIQAQLNAQMARLAMEAHQALFIKTGYWLRKDGERIML